jgi:hypothetical protein
MIELSDNQLEMIMQNAEALADDKCQEFLERVAAVLQERGEITDDEVSAAVQLALRDLIHNSAVWKEWRRNSLASHEDGEEFDAPSSDLPITSTPGYSWRLLPTWCMNLGLKVFGRRELTKFDPIART